MIEHIRKSASLFLLKWLPPCREVTELLSEQRDRGLPLAGRVKIKLHLWTCRWCRQYVHHLDLIQEELRRRAGRTGTAAPPEVLNRLKEAVRKNG